MNPTTHQARVTRCMYANSLISLIAHRGRHFYSTDTTFLDEFGRRQKVIGSRRVSEFGVSDEGRLFFKDCYTSKIVRMPTKNMKNVSGGYTLQNLLNGMAKWIMTGKTSLYKPFGPWPERTSGNPWGYADAEMAEIRDFAERIGFVTGTETEEKE